MDLWTGVMGKAYHLDKFHVPPVIDATGLDWTIDMDFKADMEDFVEMKAALNRNGLDLVPGETEMSVIVVRENK